MTNQEAIERIADHMFVHKLKEERAHYITQALQLAIEALEKQEPQPVRLERFPMNEPLSHCPACGIELSSFIHQPSGLRPKYCPICGQAVKWE